MRKFQQETEAALNANLSGLKSQMDEEASLRARLAKEKASAEEQARQLQARCSALEGEVGKLLRGVGGEDGVMQNTVG